MANIDILKSGFIGPGEERTFKTLSAALPKTWDGVALKEVPVQHSQAVREADFILVGMNTVFVLEEKSWRGDMWADENWWFVRGEARKSPLNQAEELCRLVKALFAERLSSLPGHFVEGFVVLSNDIAEVKFARTENRAGKVLSLKNCADALVQFDAGRKNPFFNVRREDVARSLGKLSARRAPKEIGLYEVIEPQRSEGEFRVWLAKHKLYKNEMRVLKVAVKPHWLSEQQSEAWRVSVVRGSEVLKANLSDLAALGRVPVAEDCFPWQDDYIVFPFHIPEGRTLHTDRLSGASMEESRVLTTVSDAFLLLSQVHERGVVHRSITPSRVYIRNDGRVSFSDFVVAKVAGEPTIEDCAWEKDPDRSFIAPECIDDAHAAKPYSDVFALASSLVFWLTGIIPSADTDITQIVASQATPIAEFAPLLSECLRKCPAERPTATAVSNCFR